MITTELPGGKVHDLPEDLADALVADETAKTAWLDITVLARNEFICWINDAKQKATRERRIRRTVEELNEGKRRPCCWPGCSHRERNGREYSLGSSFWTWRNSHPIERCIRSVFGRRGLIVGLCLRLAMASVRTASRLYVLGWEANSLPSLTKQEGGGLECKCWKTPDLVLLLMG